MSVGVLFALTLACNDNSHPKSETSIFNPAPNAFARDPDTIRLKLPKEDFVYFYSQESQFAKAEFIFEMIADNGADITDLTRDHFTLIENSRVIHPVLPILENMGGNEFKFTHFSELGEGTHHLELNLKYRDVDFDYESTFRLSGTRTFREPFTFSQLQKPVDVGFGDYNEDSFLDLVVINQNSNRLTVILNAESLVLSSLFNYDLNNSPLALSSASFESSDALTDVLIATRGTLNNLVFYKGIGSGQLEKKVNSTHFAENVKDMVALQANPATDSHLDIAILDQGKERIFILTGDGSGKFLNLGSIDAKSSPVQLVAASMNSAEDAFVDLLTVDEKNDAVHVFFARGNGTYEDAIVLPVGRGPNAVTVNDFNGDGFNDFATSNGKSEDISIILNNGNKTFQDVNNVYIGTKVTSITSAKFLRENINLAFLAPEYAKICVKEGVGDGTFPFIPVEFNSRSDATRLWTTHLAGTENRTDFVLLSPEAHTLQIFLGR